MQATLVEKALSEMRRHDTHAAFTFEPILICRIKELSELVRIFGIRTREPPRNDWPRRIAIRDRRIDGGCIDVVEREIAAICDVPRAKIAPPIWRSFHMSLKVIRGRPPIPR